jgi:hypothetical protein
MHSTPSNPAGPARPLPATGLRYRAGVAARAVAAIGGGYLLATLSTRALALALPMAPVDNVVAATLAGLVVYAVAVMWTFAAASATRAWLGLGGACALAQLAVLALGAFGGAA